MKVIFVLLSFCILGTMNSQNVYCVLSSKTYHYSEKCNFCKKPYEILPASKARENGYHQCSVCDPDNKKKEIVIKRDKPAKGNHTNEIIKKQEPNKNDKSTSGSSVKNKNIDNRPVSTDFKEKNYKR